MSEYFICISWFVGPGVAFLDRNEVFSISGSNRAASSGMVEHEMYSRYDIDRARVSTRIASGCDELLRSVQRVSGIVQSALATLPLPQSPCRVLLFFWPIISRG